MTPMVGNVIRGLFVHLHVSVGVRPENQSNVLRYISRLGYKFIDLLPSILKIKRKNGRQTMKWVHWYCSTCVASGTIYDME